MVLPHTELRVADVLDRTPWVKSLAGSARDRLYSDAFLASYQSGQTVARRGALSSSWIGVADGLLKIAAVSRSGKIVMFTGIPSGGWIGEGTVLKRELRLYDIVACQRQCNRDQQCQSNIDQGLELVQVGASCG